MEVTYTGLLAPPREVARQKIVRLEAILRPMEQVDCRVMHHHAPGAYGRECHLPAGSLVIGKIHKHAHINVVSKGRVTVFTEAGEREIEAPCTFVSEPGAKRVVLAHADTVWTTVHVTNETDLSRIEDQVIAKSYDEFAEFQQIEGGRKCLGSQ